MKSWMGEICALFGGSRVDEFFIVRSFLWMIWMIRCFWVDVGDQKSLENDVIPLAREGL
jgi:hypothetical protein